MMAMILTYVLPTARVSRETRQLATSGSEGTAGAVKDSELLTHQAGDDAPVHEDHDDEAPREEEGRELEEQCQLSHHPHLAVSRVRPTAQAGRQVVSSHR